MAEYAEFKELGYVEKSPKARLKLTTSVWRGEEYVDIREFYTREGSDEWLPTRKGVRFNKKLLGDFVEMIKKAT